VRYVIIGNGVAGVEAALAIRKADADGTITIITKSPNLHYYRPRLIEFLSGEVSLDKMTTYKDDAYEKKGIANLLGTRITAIRPDERSAIDANGRTHEYDRLLIATGGRPFVPPIAGADLPGVFTFRGVRDAERIRDYAAGVRDVAVIGGGLLGLETAHSLARMGKRPTVVEFCEWLMPRQLDRDGGGILRRILEEKGVRFVLGESVASIEGGGRAERIVMQSGATVDAGLIVISAGIRSDLALAREAGIATDKGIIVDDTMRTSAEGIYAAGDVAQHKDCVYGIWPAAREQGIAAGAAMAGQPVAYRGTVMSSSLKITGVDLYSAGDINRSDCDAIVSSGGSSYKKLLMKDRKATGAIVLGDAAALKIAQRVIAGTADPEEFKKLF